MSEFKEQLPLDTSCVRVDDKHADRCVPGVLIGRRNMLFLWCFLQFALGNSCFLFFWLQTTLIQKHAAQRIWTLFFRKNSTEFPFCVFRQPHSQASIRDKADNAVYRK